MEQHFVTKRYFSTIVTRARRIIGTALEDARHWHDTALLPLITEIKEYRDDLAQQIFDLHRAGDSRKTVQQRIVALKRDDSRLQAQLNSFQKVRVLLGETEALPASRASGEN
jgi:FtsZ-binding cell division protein ZapB